MDSTLAVAVPEPVTVMYLAYGPHRLVRNAAFSAFTFLRSAAALPRRWRLVIYTDQPDIFRGYGIAGDLIPLTALRSASAPTAYLHRSKMAALQHAAATYDGSIFYVDADTYFTESPERHFAMLTARCSIMHTPEYTVDERTRPHLYNAIKTTSFRSQALMAAQTAPEITMWNAGTIGIASPNKHLIAEVLLAADELYGVYQYHLAEQLAWALVLSRVGAIVPADDLIYHYWFGQEEITDRVVRFLRRNQSLAYEELMEKAYQLRPRATPNWRPPPAIWARVAAREVQRRVRLMRSSARPNTQAKLFEPQDDVTAEIKRRGG